MNRDKLYFILLITLLAAFFTYAYRKLFAFGMLYYGNLFPFPSASDLYRISFSSWQPMCMGTYQIQNMDRFFIGVIIQIFGDNAVVAQKVLYFSLLPIAGVMMYIFLSRFINSQLARFIASFIYSVNPATLSEFVGGSISLLVPYAVFPLLLLFSFNLVEKCERIRSMLMFTLTLGFASIFSWHIIFMFLPFLAVFSSINILIRKDLKYAFTIIALFLTSFTLCFILLLPLSIFALLSYSGATAVLPVERLIHQIEFLYSKATIPNIMIIVAYWRGSAIQLLGYHEPSIWSILGFLIPILAFSSLLFTRDKKRSTYTIVFSILAMLVILFTWLTNRGLIIELFRNFPLLFIFRHVSKTLLMLSVVYSPLIAITIDEVQKRFKTLIDPGNHKNASSALSSFILCIVIISIAISFNWPFLTGDMGLSQVRGSNYVLQPIYPKVGEWIYDHTQQERFFRTLWLPYDDKVVYWIYPHSFNVPPDAEIYGLPNIDYIKFTLSSLCNERTQHIGALLAPASVKYIIVTLTSQSESPCRIGSYYVLGNPENFVKILNKQEDIILANNETDFLIYKNEKLIPHVSIYNSNNIIYIIGDRTALLKLNNIPNFDIRHQLPIFGQQSSAVQIKKITNISDTLIFLNKDYTDFVMALIDKKYRVDASNFETNEGWSWISWTDDGKFYYGRGYVKTNVDSSLKLRFKLDENSRYDIWIRLLYAPIRGDLTFDIDDIPLNKQLKPNAPLSVFKWANLGSYTLNKGEHILTIKNSGGENAIDEVLVAPHSHVKNAFNNGMEIIYKITKLAFMYDARSFIFKSSNWEIQKSHITSHGAGELSKHVFIPKNGYYKMALYASSSDANIILKIDDNDIDKISLRNETFNWYETKPTYIKTGEHKLSIIFDNSTSLDEVIILSIKQKNGSINDIFNPAQNQDWNLQSKKISQTEYAVHIKTKEPVFIVLGESYHPSWHAYGDDKLLDHFPAFSLTNGFYLSQTGDINIAIAFVEQKKMNIAIIIWACGWIFLLSALTYTNRGYFFYGIKTFKNLIKILRGQ